MQLPNLPQPTPIRQLIREILILQEQLNTAENRSFYFRLAQERNLEKLEELHQQYEGIRAFFNTSSLDQLIEEVQQAMDTQSRIDKLESRTIRTLADKSNQNQISSLEELIELKQKYSQLPPFEKLDKSFAFE
jgi:hypothetical protein